MIKKGSFRRILVASTAFLLVLTSIYLFPQNEVKIPSKTIYKDIDTSAIYLIDKNNYVSRTTINIDSTDTISKARELVDSLINGTTKNKYLPNGFISLVPEGTKLINITKEEDIISLYFNESFLDIDINNEEKVIESIVYTLTELDGINKVKIFINDEPLLRLPKSGKTLPEVLTRSIGINKKASFTSFKNTKDITTYFINNSNDNKYFIPITFITDDDKEKIEIIIKELESKNNIDQNLSTYLTTSTELKKYEINENEINLEFNNAIFNNFNKIDEDVMYGIALSIYDTYNISNVGFIVDGKKIDVYTRKTT